MRPFLLRRAKRWPHAGLLALVLFGTPAAAQQGRTTNDTESPGALPPAPSPVPREDESSAESDKAPAPGPNGLPAPTSESAEKTTEESAPSDSKLVPRPEAPSADEEPEAQRPTEPEAPSADEEPETQRPTEKEPPATQDSSKKEIPLQARLDSPKSPSKTPSTPAHLPRSALRPEEAIAPRQPAPRTEVMPGDFVARPVTLPQGTFKMEFGQTLVLWDVPANSALAPDFALGITEYLEIGVDAPLHYDPGINEWAALHPRPHVAATWTDRDDYEIGTRVRALVPARPSIDPSLSVEVPVLWRLSRMARLDLIPAFHVGLGDERALVAQLKTQGSWQLSRSVFAGLGGTAQIGFVDSRDSGFDPEVLLGFTHQNYGRSFVDFVTRVFAQGIGGAPEGHVSKGAGFAVALTFYPELY